MASGQHTVTRYHDFSAGHRVVGHEGKCAMLHGHNYRVYFNCRTAPGVSLDEVGRVIDFSVIKSTLCQWLEDNWDHKFLVWTNDPMREKIYAADPRGIVAVSFNPTAENMACFLVETVGPIVLRGTDVELYSVVVEETRKCSAEYVRA